MSVHYWDDTLCDYLVRSNEDERVTDFLEAFIVNYFREKNKSCCFKWLEVGPGPGTKTLSILKLINNLKSSSFVSLSMLEPSIAWRNYLKAKSLLNKIKEHTCDFEVIGDNIEHYTENLTKSELDSFDLISVIHVMYSNSILKALLKLIDLFDEKHGCMIFNIVESEYSDFSKLRKIFNESGIDVPQSMLNLFLTELDRRGLPYKRHIINNKICNIELNEVMVNDNYWLFSFLLGYSEKDYCIMEKKEKTNVLSITRNYIKNLESAVLHVPDEAVLIIPRGTEA